MAHQYDLARRFYWRALWLRGSHMLGVWPADDAQRHAADRN